MKRLLKLYIDAYSNHPREIWILAILSLINRMGTMVLPFLSVYYTTVLDFSLVQTGYLLSALGVGMFVGSYVGGKLCEMIGSRIVMAASLMLGGILLISIQFYTDLSSLMILMFLTSAFGDAYRPSMMVSAGNFVPKEQMGRTMSLLRLMINVGMALGPALGGYLAAYAGYSWLFWIDGLTCFGSAIFFIITSRNWKSDSQKKTSTKEEIIALKKLPPTYKNKDFMIFLGSTFLLATIFMQMFHTVPIFLKDHWGFGEYYYGQLLGFSCLLVVIIEMPLIHNIEDKKKNNLSLKIGLLFIGLSYLLFFGIPSLWICFVMTTIWTLGEILNLPLNSSYAMTFGRDKQRGRYMAYFWMTWSLANIISPIAGLNFVEYFGFSAFWILLSVLTLISLLLLNRVFEVR